MYVHFVRPSWRIAEQTLLLDKADNEQLQYLVITGRKNHLAKPSRTIS